jgi:hypothetical protein
LESQTSPGIIELQCRTTALLPAMKFLHGPIFPFNKSRNLVETQISADHQICNFSRSRGWWDR